MKEKFLKVSLAALAGLFISTGCNKKGHEPATVNSSSNHMAQAPATSSAKNSGGFSVIALTQIPGTGVSELNNAYNMSSGTGGSFQPITIGSNTNLTYVSGIARIATTTNTVFAVTNSMSNKPGSLFAVDVNTKAATYIGRTTIGSLTGPIVYLQDIEFNGTFYYAIEANTRRIYLSIPGTGGAGNNPLIWNMVANQAAAPVSSPFQGLDIYSNTLMVYGNGLVTSGTYSSSASSKIGYYAKYTINTVAGTLAFVGVAATNIPYTLGTNEDAALLISDDTSINGTFVVSPTPQFSFNHYYNLNLPLSAGLPYFGTPPSNPANVSGTIATSSRGFVDYAYF